jgi:hypothetical protein
MHSNRISLSRDDISAGGFVRRILVCGHPGDWVRSLQFNSHHFGGGFVRRKIVCRHSRDWVRSVHLALRRGAVVCDALPYCFLTTAHDSFSGARSRIEIVHKFIGHFVLPESWLRFAKTHLVRCVLNVALLLVPTADRSVASFRCFPFVPHGPHNPCKDLRWLRFVDFCRCLMAFIIRAEIFGGFVSLIFVGASWPS